MFRRVSCCGSFRGDLPVSALKTCLFWLVRVRARLAFVGLSGQDVAVVSGASLEDCTGSLPGSPRGCTEYDVPELFCCAKVDVPCTSSPSRCQAQIGILVTLGESHLGSEMQVYAFCCSEWTSPKCGKYIDCTSSYCQTDFERRPLTPLPDGLKAKLGTPLLNLQESR